MRCSYSCRTAEHVVARRRFLGDIARGIGLGVGAGSFVPFIQPVSAKQLSSQQRHVIVFYLAGGSSQLETWDPKPGTDTGGPFRAIPTSVPGIHVSELLPKTATQMHHLALVRSINTNENDHGLGRYLMETGRKKSPATDYPHLGAVAARALADGSSPLPGHIHVSSGSGGSRRNDAAYLGPKYGSIVIGAAGGGLRNSQRPNNISENTDTLRQQLRRKVNDRFALRRRTADLDAYSQSYEQALELMHRRDVFDVSKETEKEKQRYGDTDLGRQCLLARRLIEHGITFVQVTHSNYDTHNENFNFHLEQVGEFDVAFATLIEDLADRGLLDHTLVVVMSEFGRTPRINQYYGRDHWGKSWSVALAGCRIQRGAVIGKTNANGTEVVDREVDHRHLFHTYLQAVGLDSTGEFHVDGRDVPMADPSGEPIQELLT